MNFPEQLRAARKAAKLTQAAADAILETCKGQVAAWESARNTPHVLTQEAALARLKPFAYVWQNPDFSDTPGDHVAGSETPLTGELRHPVDGVNCDALGNPFITPDTSQI